MSVRARHVGWVALVGLPALTALLWIAGGSEVFTKPRKAAQVAVQDPLFGDTTMQTQFVRGPIFGVYIGLDAVLLVTVACLVAGVIWCWVAYRWQRSTLTSGGTKP